MPAGDGAERRRVTGGVETSEAVPSGASAVCSDSQASAPAQGVEGDEARGAEHHQAGEPVRPLVEASRVPVLPHAVLNDESAALDVDVQPVPSDTQIPPTVPQLCELPPRCVRVALRAPPDPLCRIRKWVSRGSESGGPCWRTHDGGC